MSGEVSEVPQVFEDEDAREACRLALNRAGIEGQVAERLLEALGAVKVKSPQVTCPSCLNFFYPEMPFPDHKTRLDAAKFIVERQLGKPTERVEVRHREVPLNELTDQELLDRIGRAGSSG